MRIFISGVLTMACVVVALFFLQYWRTSRDRLFAFFAVAFAAMAVDWVGHAVVQTMATPNRPAIYLVRLFAFLVIIIAIIDKNRQSRRR